MPCDCVERLCDLGPDRQRHLDRGPRKHQHVVDGAAPQPQRKPRRFVPGEVQLLLGARQLLLRLGQGPRGAVGAARVAAAGGVRRSLGVGRHLRLETGGLLHQCGGRDLDEVLPLCGAATGVGVRIQGVLVQADVLQEDPGLGR